jgi:anaerobic magnesium-protoporphyrin IX monomethyl ester cyclase
MRWYTQMGRRVWPFEIFNYLFRDRRLTDGPTVAEFWGAPQDAEEEAMSASRPERRRLEAA